MADGQRTPPGRPGPRRRHSSSTANSSNDPTTKINKEVINKRRETRRSTGLDYSSWWNKKILENIRSASVFVFALSDESLHSKPCLAELDYARKLDPPVLPVKVGPAANLRSSPVADLQTITFRSDNALSAFKIMAAIQQKAHELKPLPNPLPTPPPIPYAYLLALGRQIDSIELDQEQQTTVVDQLHRAILEETDDGVHQDIVAMLSNLIDKPWATRPTELAATTIIGIASVTPDEQSAGGRPQTNPTAEESEAGPITAIDIRFG